MDTADLKAIEFLEKLNKKAKWSNNETIKRRNMGAFPLNPKFDTDKNGNYIGESPFKNIESLMYIGPEIIENLNNFGVKTKADLMQLYEDSDEIDIEDFIKNVCKNKKAGEEYLYNQKKNQNIKYTVREYNQGAVRSLLDFGIVCGFPSIANICLKIKNKLTAKYFNDNVKKYPERKRNIPRRFKL
jgi:hypothetical protein